jgi:hypothetical protein
MMVTKYDQAIIRFDLIYYLSKIKKYFHPNSSYGYCYDIPTQNGVVTKETLCFFVNNIKNYVLNLSNEDKKNNDEYREIETKLKSCIRSCHNYLYSNG